MAIGLSALLAVGVAILGLSAQEMKNPSANPPASATNRTGPLVLASVSTPNANSVECVRLLAALPAQLTEGTDKVPSRPLAKPAPAAAAAWGDAQHDPVMLRCGLERPAELTPTAQLLEVSGVRWLKVDGDDATTWFAVDRAVYIALTTPNGAGSGPLQDMSAIIGQTLDAKPVNAG